MAQVCPGTGLSPKALPPLALVPCHSRRLDRAAKRPELPIIFRWCRPPKAPKNVGKTLSAGADAVLRAKTSVTRQASHLHARRSLTALPQSKRDSVTGDSRLGPKQVRLATRTLAQSKCDWRLAPWPKASETGDSLVRPLSPTWARHCPLRIIIFGRGDYDPHGAVSPCVGRL
jgi:hypothetical protein